MAPSFSVIVNTLGRPRLLADTLRGLEALRGPDYEIIVVNGPGNDDTEDVLAKWAGRIKQARCPEANLSMSRNIGLELAGGEIVAFIDDDAIAHPAWLEELARPYRDCSIAAVGGYTVGRLGSSYQARATLCDRLGDPWFVDGDLDLSRVCAPGSWVFPSLLGTNCSFRRDALAAIGGFDETFTYYLEETDLCLRLVDAGWRVVYAPEALVWHQFASSALRSADMTRRSIRAVMRSHSYFINRHGVKPWSPIAAQSAADRLARLAGDWALGNRAACSVGAIDERQAARLDRELHEGLAEGHALAQRRASEELGHWRPGAPPAFKALGNPANSPLTVAFACREYLATRESGIPRWTRLLVEEFARRGHRPHVICETRDTEPRIRFVEGVWIHEIPCEAENHGWLVERFGLPEAQAQWAECLRSHMHLLRSFGIELLSFPIWDLEGIGCLDEPGLAICMSLHTTYGISARFRDDWGAQPLLRERLVRPMQAAETMALAATPHILANSRSILAELEADNGLDLSGRARLAVHGVPSADRPVEKRGFSVLFAGRFEQRKGIDLALSAFVQAAEADPRLHATFAGEGELRAVIPTMLASRAEALVATGRLSLPGMVERDELDRLYAEADVALLPSRYESFGLVGAEAMAHGCAVLALDNSGMAEVVRNGIDGILVAAEGDVAGNLAVALARLFAEPNVLAAMQKAARENATRNFSVESMATQVEMAFRAFLAGSEPR